MSNKKRKYSNEFKAEALQLLRSSGRSANSIEAELGITQGLLSKWRRIDEYEKAGTGYEPEGESLEAKVKRLERENSILRQEREILKKQWLSSANQSDEISVYERAPRHI